MHAVAGELLQKLGTPGAPLAEGLLLRLGEMCAGASDAAEEEAALDQATSRDALAAQTALGQGIRSMGPQAILQVLPLGLVEASQLIQHCQLLTWALPVLHLLCWPHCIVALERKTQFQNLPLHCFNCVWGIEVAGMPEKLF